jgi:sulfur relay (sulfurtransferase) complex TusBCD TusD component (DsrE family)
MRGISSEEDLERLFGVVQEVGGETVSIFLLGDGVLCSRKGQTSYHSKGVRAALKEGAEVWASAKDLRARGIASHELEHGITMTEDLEGTFLDEAMEKADRVVSW